MITNPNRQIIAHTVLAMRVALRKRGVRPTKYYHLKAYARRLIQEMKDSRNLRRV